MYRVYRVNEDSIEMLKDVRGKGEVRLFLTLDQETGEVEYRKSEFIEDFSMDEIEQVLIALVMQIAVHFQQVPQSFLGTVTSGSSANK